MPTTVTSKIGMTNTPVTMDYSTLQSWEDACPANLVTADQIWKGECYDQGEFTATGAGILSISGATTDSTRYVHLDCAAGASFADKAAVRTTPLAYSASNGVAIRYTGSNYHVDFIWNQINYTRIRGLQIKIASGSAQQWGFRIGGTGALVEKCISENFRQGMRLDGGSPTVNNCLVIGCSEMGINVANTVVINGCTIVKGTGTGIRTNTYSNLTLKNSAVFGYSVAAFIGGTGSSVYNANSCNNASDATNIPGSNNVTLPFNTEQFQNITNDFRVGTGFGLRAGIYDSTNIPNDVSGQARDSQKPWIGCWESTDLPNATLDAVGETGRRKDAVARPVSAGWL